MAIDEKCWKHLTKTEQQSLSLTLSYSKSSWEVGEILKITHYKYLELKERSEKFFRMFHDYYQIYDQLIHPQTLIDTRFQDYIYACLEQRSKRREAAMAYGDASLLVKPISTKFIINQMEILKNSNRDHDRDLFKLILEFDRWNNWRILPRVLQQPSAYKRRNNRRDTFYIKYQTNKLKWSQIKVLRKMFYCKGIKGGKHCFMVLFSKENYEEGYEVVRTKDDIKTIEAISKYYIYLFDNEPLAEAYGHLVSRYQYGSKEPKEGLKFWPEYRNLIEAAVNYKQVNNIDFYTDKLDMAYMETKKPKKTKIKKKIRFKDSD